ncbi:PREDICTED: bifunctional epoxide hydrolase 2-like isoform X2 [Ipomoea nil]|uniref:bifunctional epoxide hydrolase 2-like isoform X2 n=1 Tax=Ipomoea nil TaxID=35883 RepID=UPI0009013A22|nr:PREDICTED: bifunctional epoxide hydrolase 2-like isoform X2 [Ipomoea nil]
MEKITHKTVGANGINMHIAELGEGPLVLFLHGFPELWFSWRYQILFLAAKGYRAVAPDLRGYGETTGAPTNDSSKSTVFHAVGDLIELLQSIAPEEDKVFVVGHDWGAIIAWHLCLFRPDKVKALVNLSVHFLARDPHQDLVEIYRATYGDDHYFVRFQVPGEIEAEFAHLGVKTCLKDFFTYHKPQQLYFPKGKGFSANSDGSNALPAWLPEEDLDYYVSRYEKTGFTGGVNYYRALKLNWELTAPWSEGKVMVPTKFIVGDLDLVYHIEGAKEYIHDGGFKNDVPLLEDVVVLEGVGHFINQEAHEEVNNHIYNFINKF